MITGYLGRKTYWGAMDQARQSAPVVIGEAAALARVQSPGPAVVMYGGLPCLTSAGSRDAPCVHVEEFAEMLADAGGDRDVVAQFLREISLHPGVVGLLYIDIMDVWWHWRDEKMIGPLFAQDAGVAVLPYESKPDWERAAELEPIEDVLARAGLPECSRWPTVRMDEPGQATMVMPPAGLARAVFVRADPPLVFFVSLDDGVPLGFRPDTMYGLADGIRITAGRHQDIADGLRLANRRPLTCLVSVTTERQPPEDDAEATGIAISTDPERGLVALKFGPEFFDWLADDPHKAHEIAGMAIRHAIAAVAGQPAADGQKFLAAWNVTPPIMLVHRFRNTGSASVPTDPVPHGDLARARAYRSIGTAMAKTEPPPGPLTERDVIADVSTVIETLLRRRLSESAPALIDDVARALNAAHAAYWRYAHDPHFALAAPWASDWQAAALEGKDPGTRIRPLELLLEFLILTPPRGHHHPDRYELAELEETASALLEQRTRLNATDVGLSHILDPDLEDEDDDPVPEEVAAVAGLKLNFSAYAEARGRDRLRIRTPAPARVAAQQADASPKTGAEASTDRQGRTFSAFEPIGSFDLPAHLLAADALMRDNLGTGLDGIRAVLGTAVDWPTGESGVAVAEAGQLASEAEEWSGLPRAEIEAAVALLSLDPQRLPGPVHRYWEVERLSHRLRLRPFPAIDGRIWIMPWAAEATQELFLIYLQDSRLPYLDPALAKSAATSALMRHRQRRNFQFEADAAAVPRDLGLPYRANWTVQDARSDGMAALPGEVDLII
ncbi:MAG TPA: hypothetical protein VMU94_24320, partial [Streptosporangiaceae bacterium]|nr:hypothetical protein [Streptosporangiaceae bacterium]